MKPSHDRGAAVAPAVAPPRLPAPCQGRVRERARFEWWIGDPGDPADRIQEVLSGYRLLVDDLTAMSCHQAGTPGTVCGAAVLVSAAAGNLIAGRPPGPVSPARRVPDVAVVVYEHATSPTTDALPAGSTGVVGSWRSSWTATRHAAAVVRVRDAIGRGDVYQVNVVGHWSAPFRGDPGPALARLAALPGARYAGALTGDGWAVGCASPESLVTVREGQVWTRPIKGTRPATPAGRDALLRSAKERAEHVMIVDLERNDLSRIAETGSVRVEELFAIRRWCQLWQAESVVRARLAPGVGIGGLLRAMCPGGSVTGAPKFAAIEQIAAIEPVGRGPSMGAFGYVTAESVDFGLTIRTVAFDGDTVHLWAGGGVTWDSDPHGEVAEAVAKAAPLMAALAGPGWRPPSGHPGDPAAATPVTR